MALALLHALSLGDALPWVLTTAVALRHSCAIAITACRIFPWSLCCS